MAHSSNLSIDPGVERHGPDSPVGPKAQAANAHLRLHSLHRKPSALKPIGFRV